MEIVHIASEIAPIAKVGGLADVVYGLSKALQRSGHEPTILLPYYDCADLSLVDELTVAKMSLQVEEDAEPIALRVWKGSFAKLKLIFIDPIHPRRYFKRGAIYGEPDDTERFLFFCKACITYLKTDMPDVIHLHDWPAAGAALLADESFKSIFTIHNLQHQGRCAPSNLQKLGITIDENILADPNYPQTLNLMRGALAKSHFTTTVSPSYLEEIFTEEYGWGLEKDLQAHREKLRGILNGIDTAYWDPATDPHLPYHYSSAAPTEGKKLNKRRMLTKLGLQPSDKPLTASITRLVWQKGPDLILHAIETVLELGGQFALLGSAPDRGLRKQLARYDTHPNVKCILTYNAPLAHQLYAASDMLLMPSIFEPCGLAQLIAMRYGSVPLVRRTGGLKDTIEDGSTGFCFTTADYKGVDSVLQRAFAAYGSKKWASLIKRGMTQELSWDLSAEQYLQLYKSLQ